MSRKRKKANPTAHEIHKAREQARHIQPQFQDPLDRIPYSQWKSGDVHPKSQDKSFLMDVWNLTKRLIFMLGIIAGAGLVFEGILLAREGRLLFVWIWVAPSSLEIDPEYGIYGLDVSLSKGRRSPPGFTPTLSKIKDAPEVVSPPIEKQ